ncbi:hypothetical protein RJT34_32805 [Clitoria ternatea]|uniref:GTD-binding domain-containing protein n=1 Tax=Clitoria ternatea TaxID=43366 RepID=A0AAN9EY56_CLITE
MVEIDMAESDIIAMKETLRAQQQLLQKLYTELDQEREASATAASEAMDMILRLQGEKAAVKMESSHYKRMAEEKIGHAEATLELFDELMYQKEMEIASLEFQVLAYKNKLLALGSDFNASEFEFPEDLLSSRNDQHNGENGQCSSSIIRLSSLPPIQLKSNLRTARKRERSHSPIPIPVPDVTPKVVESDDQEVTSPSMDLPRKSADFGSLDAYWNQIKSLDQKVKVISHCKESRGRENCETHLRSRRGRSCSIFTQACNKITCDQTDRVSPINSSKQNCHEGKRDREAGPSRTCSVNVHDVFEVPQTRVNQHGKRRLESWISDADNRLKKPDSVSEDTMESHVKHDIDKLRSMLGAHNEIRTPSPKDMKAIVWQKKEGVDENSCNAQAEFQKLHQRIDQLERENVSVRQEIMHGGDREEHLRLLKDIYSQLKSMQLEMRSWKPQKAAPKEEIPLDPLHEAMVYFWI